VSSCPAVRDREIIPSRVSVTALPRMPQVTLAGWGACVVSSCPAAYTHRGGAERAVCSALRAENLILFHPSFTETPDPWGLPLSHQHATYSSWAPCRRPQPPVYRLSHLYRISVLHSPATTSCGLCASHLPDLAPHAQPTFRRVSRASCTSSSLTHHLVLPSYQQPSWHMRRAR